MVGAHFGGLFLPDKCHHLQQRSLNSGMVSTFFCSQCGLIGFPFAMHSWLWQLSGKVLVNVGQPSIAISRKVFGWGPTKEYSAAHIKDLRASSSNVSLNHPQLLWYSDGPYAWQSQFGSLAFDYGSKTVRFGAGIEEAEAKQVLAEIFQKFPQYSSETTGT